LANSESDDRSVLDRMADAAGIETSGSLPFAKGDAIKEPEFTIAKSGAWVYVWDYDVERIGLKLEHLYVQGRDLWCMLTVLYKVGDGKTVQLLSRTRWNMRSTSHTDSQTRVLNRRLDRSWDGRLQQVKAHVEDNFKIGDELVWLGDGDAPAPVEMLVGPFIEKGQHTVIAAYGGSTKSLFGTALAISVADGLSVMPGLFVPKKAKTLYIDYETDRPVHEWRYRALLRGIEAGDVNKMVGYLKVNVPLIDAAEYIRAYIQEHDFEFGITDSASRAVGGETVDEGAVITYFNTISSFGISWLTIAHKPKNENTRGPAGNSHWYHQARSYWEIAKDQIHGDSTAHIALNHEKANNGIMQRSIGFRIEFTDDAIVYHSEDAATSPEIAERLPLVQQIENHLLENAQATAQEIADALGKTRNRVSNVLKQQEGILFRGTAERSNRRWGVLTKGEPQEKPVRRWWIDGDD
jgi:predicted XRE-type DNA-binding protein